MGFWSNLGKGLLKVAPIAASFIPGVGPLAGAAIGGITSAASKKASGGSWTDALKSGLMGAGTAYAGAKVPAGAGKGLSPTKGFWNTAKDVAKKTGQSILGGNAGSIFAGNGQPASINVKTNPLPYGPSANTAGGVMPRGGYGYNQSPMNQLDQSFPNLAQSIFQGRQEAMRNQPFRSGYDVITDTGERDEQDLPITTTQRMPRIFSTGTGGRRNRRRVSR